jgi:hypothetical protein
VSRVISHTLRTGQTARKPRPAGATVAGVTYLIVGLDRQTLAPWHENICADDVAGATHEAVARAAARGIDLVLAAVIGPNSSIVSVPVAELDDRATSSQAA